MSYSIGIYVKVEGCDKYALKRRAFLFLSYLQSRKAI